MKEENNLKSFKNISSTSDNGSCTNQMKSTSSRCFRVCYKGNEPGTEKQEDKGLFHGSTFTMKPRSATTSVSQSMPSSPTRSCRDFSLSSSSKTTAINFTVSEPTSPRRKRRVLLRQSALENSKESLHDDDKLSNLHVRNVAKMSNQTMLTSSNHHPTRQKVTAHSWITNSKMPTTTTTTANGKSLNEKTTTTLKERITVGQANNLTMTTKNAASTSDVNGNCWYSREKGVSKGSSCISSPSPSNNFCNSNKSKPPDIKINPSNKITQPSVNNNKKTNNNRVEKASLSPVEKSRKLISREASFIETKLSRHNSSNTSNSRIIHGNSVGQKDQKKLISDKDLKCSKVIGASVNVSERNPKKSTFSFNNTQRNTTKNSHFTNKTKMDSSLDNGKTNGNSEVYSPLEFIVPLQSNLEILEGSELQLIVKIRGARKVVWVKNSKIVPNIPPDFEYKSNPVDGTYSLNIRDTFVEDTGLYICEAYGLDEESDAISWCHVDVIEDILEEDDTSIEIEEVPEQTRRRSFIVPVIITSEPSDPIISEEMMDPSTPAADKRLIFSEIRENSEGSSRELYEDALEQLDQDSKVVDLTLNESECVVEEEEEIEEIRSDIQSFNKSHDCSIIELPVESVCNNNPEPCDSVVLNGDLDTVFNDIIPCSNNIEQDKVELSDFVEPEGLEKITNSSSVVSENLAHSEESQSNDVEQLPVQTQVVEKIVSEISSFISPEPSSSSHIKSYLTQSSTESAESDAFRSPSLDDSVILTNDLSQNTSSSPEAIGPINRFRDSLSDPIPLAPRILMGPSSLIAILGETINLRVKIQTSTEVNTMISWCKFVKGVYKRVGVKSETPAEEETLHLQINRESSDLITLKINSVNYEDSGKYRARVRNEYGTDYHYCILSVEGPPEPPAIPPKVEFERSTTSIHVSWQCCPYDGGSAVTGYCLEVSTKSNKPTKTQEDNENWKQLTFSNFIWLCYTLKNPQPNHWYAFRVSVENAYGKGNPSISSAKLLIPEDALPSSVDSSDKNTSDSITRKISFANDSDSSETGYEYKEVSLKKAPFSEYYDKHEQLGKGRFGIVFKVTNKLTTKPYAGKFVKCIKGKDKERAQLEYQIMNELKYHPKLICLVDAFEMQREVVIVTEMIKGGELFERVVADDFTLTERDCIIFLRQICDGVKYIHESGIMHLDLKPENILCTTKTSNQIKIIDFGLAQYYDPNDPIRVLFGTAEFVSPEIINYDTICPATDMWSVGVITYILLSGLSPFLGDDDSETFANITTGEFDFEDESFDKISEDAKDFISSLIVKRKDKRLTAIECLEHKWLALSDAEKKDVVLPTDKLKRFLLRRKWQKTGNAIRALGRIANLYSTSRRTSSGTSSTSSNSPFGSLFTRTMSTQDSIESDSVFGSMEAPNSPTPDSSPLISINNVDKKSHTTPTENNIASNIENDPKSCSRSDSGVCDVASTVSMNE